jgi:hypothetical protein
MDRSGLMTTTRCMCPQLQSWAEIRHRAQPRAAGWRTDGEMVRTPTTLHAEDDDWCHASTLVHGVMNDGEQYRLVA